MSGRVLILGGTGEARALAQQLADAGTDIVSSLAGRVQRPRLPVGPVRIGGFGGPEALSRWLAEHEIRAVVDATHPFAQRIARSAAEATKTAAVPLLRLERPGWEAGPGDRWHWVADLASAADAVGELGARRVWLTSGRQGLEAFATLDAWFLIRCVDPPTAALPRHHEVLLDRGPYALDAERRLLADHRIDLLVTKDSGGSLTEAKLTAARERQVAVIVVRRPARPATPTVTTVAEAAAWAAAQAAG